MPFHAELRIPVQGACVALLCRSDTVRSAIKEATEWDGELRIDVLPLLLLTDVYGDEAQQNVDDVALWGLSTAHGLLTEADIANPRHVGFIGQWNLPFLRWLRSISVATDEQLTVSYDHERGDTPYEYAWWVSSPVAPEGPCEVFGLASHGGRDEAEWEFEVVRFTDGRSKANESGQCDDPPRYL
jgi:hypothetical protein